MVPSLSYNKIQTFFPIVNIKGQHACSVKGQTENILGFAGQIVSSL